MRRRCKINEYSLIIAVHISTYETCLNFLCHSNTLHRYQNFKYFFHTINYISLFNLHFLSEHDKYQQQKNINLRELSNAS